MRTLICLQISSVTLPLVLNAKEFCNLFFKTANLLSLYLCFIPCLGTRFGLLMESTYYSKCRIIFNGIQLVAASHLQSIFMSLQFTLF